MHLIVFFSLVTTSHILAAAMDVLGMDSLDDNPYEQLIPGDVNALSKSEILTQIANVIVHSYVNLNHRVEDPMGTEGPDKVKVKIPPKMKIPVNVKRILEKVKKIVAKDDIPNKI